MTLEEYKSQVEPGRRIHITTPSSNINATACLLYMANGVEYGLRLDDGRILRVSEWLVPFLVMPNAD